MWKLAVLQSGILILVYWLGQDYLLFTEEMVYDAPVGHPLFANDEHFIPEYWNSSMKQRDRVKAIEDTMQATIEAMQVNGVHKQFPYHVTRAHHMSLSVIVG